MPRTLEEMQEGSFLNTVFELFEADGKTSVGTEGYYFGIQFIPEAIRSEYAIPPFPVNENGQTYGSMAGVGPHNPVAPQLVAAIGTDGITEGYVYAADLEGDSFGFGQPNNPDEAVLYMKRLEERHEEMARTGEKYLFTIPLYANDGVTVIGEFGVGGTSVEVTPSLHDGEIVNTMQDPPPELPGGSVAQSSGTASEPPPVVASAPSSEIRSMATTYEGRVIRVEVLLAEYSPVMSSVPGYPFAFDITDGDYELQISVDWGFLNSWEPPAGIVTNLGNSITILSDKTLYWLPEATYGFEEIPNATITVNAMKSGEIVDSQEIAITYSDYMFRARL